MTLAGKENTLDATHTVAAFPLGGIGTGNVSLGARGELRDWEIFNNPAKGNALPNSFFALRVQSPGAEPVVRVLEGTMEPPFNLSHGYHPAQNGGLPRFARSTLRGEYPFAWVELEDPELPVSVGLEAYTPFVPLNPDDSGIPCAVLTYTVRNHSNAPVALTLVGSICNPVGGVRYDSFRNITQSRQGRTINEYRNEAAMRGLFMRAEDIAPDDFGYGDVSLVTTHPDVTVKPAWMRGAWYDFLQEFWDDLTEDGQLNDLQYSDPSPDRRPDSGSLGVRATLAPGAEQSFRFILSWSFPNRRHTWRPVFVENAIFADTPSNEAPPVVRNHYAAQFADSWAAAAYVVRDYDRLESETRKFHEALFGSTLPKNVLDAVSANIVTLRSNTCFWFEDGRFYGWEGCFDNGGSCAGTCAHVWSYAFTPAFLFPSLEREMRRIDFAIETEADGFMNFRNFKSMNETFNWGGHKPEAAADGQAGSILRAYREWQLSGDRAWLDPLWAGIKRSIEFSGRQWDTDGDGVLDSKQHNTYDIEFYGPNPLTGIYYLAALRAVEEMAKVMGDTATAEKCHTTFDRGSQRLDELLWNGKYFVQRLEDVNAYKYQHGLGCLSDQLLGQLHAHVLGLGDLLPQEHVRKAIKSVFDYNFRTSFKDHINCQRTYVLNDEAGLVLCSWPEGGRPTFPFVYSDEVWTGVEYHVAAELIYNGWVNEGLQIIDAIARRHDGIRRNRWNEVECGHHYARAMSSWVVLLALSGQQSQPGRLSFNPVLAASTDPNVFQCFWSNGHAWGRYTQRRASENAPWQPQVEVFGGSLDGVTITACGKSWQHAG